MKQSAWEIDWEGELLPVVQIKHCVPGAAGCPPHTELHASTFTSPKVTMISVLAPAQICTDANQAGATV